MEILLEYLAKGFLMMLAISMPCVLVAAGIGLVVGILQAVTQVQEQTIAAAPKILGVFLVIIIGGVGFIRLLTNLFQEGMVLAFQHVPQNQEFVLEPDFHQYTTPFEYEMKDRFRNIDDIDKRITKKDTANDHITKLHRTILLSFHLFVFFLFPPA